MLKISVSTTVLGVVFIIISLILNIAATESFEKEKKIKQKKTAYTLNQ